VFAIDLTRYTTDGRYDELFTHPGEPRPATRALYESLSRTGVSELRARQRAADAAIVHMGITFTVYGQGGNIDRAWPFDVIPRIIEKREWDRVAAGLVQRVDALNLFIGDLYGEQRILKDGVVPRDLIRSSPNFREVCVGARPPHGVWAHVCGSDLIRDRDGTFYVLEDNLRIPSGVSYMLENRLVMKRVYPELFQAYSIQPVDDYPLRLYETLASLSPRTDQEPEVVVLTPGFYNAAYFEHAYLAQQMGAELVEARDLVVMDEHVYMKTIAGPQRVDVIYRRTDDIFLDPEAFDPESVLGVPGLIRAWRAGNVALANAPGAGVADDKVVYSYVPDIIRYYLDQDPILPNVPTYRCHEPRVLEHVLECLDELVVKPANESGGYGMLVGPSSTAEERAAFAERVKASPRNYIAQPTIALSTVPTLVDGQVQPRHVDLRPFVLSGADRYVTAGGLTRVALRRGSLVVNSSQGGGSKDTWVVED
jgi:uncharacterized circularly permuted ATP-grasp superfamily protein